jgi:type IV pilus assembly protein PilQ
MKRSIAVNRLKGMLGLTMAGFALMLAGTALHAAETSTNLLQSIDVQTLSGKQVQLTLHMSAAAPEPLAFTIDKPARISLDLPNTSLALNSRRIDVRSNGLDSVLAAEANGRARVVLNLDQLQPYQTRVSGNDIIVTVGAVAAVASAPAAVRTAPATAAAEVAGPRAIKSIDFRRGENGSGRLVVKLTDPRTPINLRQQGSQILVDFAGADLPRNLTRRFDTMDFATPVTGFDALRVNGDTRIVLNTSGEFEQLAYQSDDQYVVEVQTVTKAVRNVADAPKVYTGEKLSLNFQDIETRAVLQLLADASGQNIVVSDTVTGSVTLRLQSVPWDQALDIVMRTKGLDKRQDGNVILVAPADELAAREKADLSSKKDLQELAPIRTEYLQMNYAKASDIAALLKSSAGSGGGGGGSNSMLSARGSVSVDERTNTLLLADTADKITEVRKLVATLDIAIKQVLIEARIVIVNDDFERDLGVRTGLTSINRNGNDGLFMSSGTAAATDVGLSSAISNLGSTGSVFPVSVPTGANAPSRYNVNLPVANPAGSLAFMVLGSDYIVDLELSAAQAEGRGEIVSSPRIITSNQKEATVEAGTEIPYQQAAGGASGGTTIEFKKAVLSLKVKPLITPDNNIILDLVVSKDSVGTVIVTSGGVNVPSIDTRTLTTQVLVGDGQTVVLGGIFESEQRDTTKKVPMLGDIPVFGYLFKNKTKVNNKNELLIFVTPKILREGVTVN